MTWTSFDKRTGRVVGKHSAEIPQAMLRGLAIIEGDYTSGFYIDPDTSEPCPLKAIKAAVKGNAITGLPDGTEVKRGGKVLAVGDCSFAADYDETITLDLVHPHYRPVRVSVDLKAGDKGDVPLEQDVRELRAVAYDDIREQLDAIWKGGEEAARMRARIMAVKDRFPKKVRE